MKTKLIIGLFLCLCSLQIIIPLSMIVKRESVLKYGEQFKFKAAPVDPYDAFRGRYVALRIEEDNILLPVDLKINPGQSVYVAISIDEQGFARLATLSANKPQGNAYIQARVQYVSNGKAYFELPFDRYYMEEKAAPRAERIYREHAQRNKQDAYIIVRIKDGVSVLESLYVGGQRIEDAVK